MSDEEYKEVITELRHKYITILKSLYWEFFESGQCSADAIIYLSSSCDNAFDEEKEPLNDWKHVDDW
jgi:hypothetical protein